MEFKHKPVMLNEVIAGLNIQKDGIYIDCTMGGGGHSSEILKKLSNKGRLIGFDRDMDAISFCKDKFKNSPNVDIFHANFKEAPRLLREKGINEVDGILVDLGVSSYQIDNDERGFSYFKNGRLDMRMDREQELDGYKVVNEYSKEKLLKILYEYGEESNAKRIVENILSSRAIKPITTTFELKEIIDKSFPAKMLHKGGLSKKTFQAIRIEVNKELIGLDDFLKDGINLLKKGGRMAVLSFHSLEDRIVKNVFKEYSQDCICPPKTPICICGHHAEVKLINNKPITAGQTELEDNPRSSSAKLRIIEKI